MDLEAHLVVEEEVIDQWLNNLPVILMNPDNERNSYTITPAFGDVQVRGRASELEKILNMREPFRIQVDNLPARQKPYFFKLWYPTNLVRIKSIRPDQIQVIIQTLPQKTTSSASATTQIGSGTTIASITKQLSIPVGNSTKPIPKPDLEK